MCDREKILQKWVNFAGLESDDIDGLAAILEHYDDVELAKPFIISDLKKDVSPRVICARYGISFGCMRGIARRAGVRYSPRRKFRRV